MKTPVKKRSQPIRPAASPYCLPDDDPPDPRARARWVPTPSSTLRRVPADVRQRVLARVDELVAIARERYEVPFAAPLVYFNTRGSVGGTADPFLWAIHLNPALLLENEAHYMADIIPHEVAHLITVNAVGNRGGPHGRYFQAVMLSLGAEPSVYHQLDVRGATEHLPAFRYHCACQVHEITSRRHNALVRGQSYGCAHCGQPIRFTGEWRRDGEWTRDPVPPVAPAKRKSARRRRRS